VARAIDSALGTTATGRVDLEPARSTPRLDSIRAAPAITSAAALSLAGVAKTPGDDALASFALQHQYVCL
jgi:hypothetical protein